MSVSPKLQLQQLILLQKLDDEIAEHRKLLAEIPVQIDSERAELETKKKVLSIAKEEIDTLQKNRKAIESEVQGENDHMAKAKTKLPAVKTNKEYTAVLVEVDAFKERVTRLEDKELEIMEVLEEKQKKIQENFRWITPIMLFLLSALIGAYMIIINGWNESLTSIKAYAAEFEDEVRETYMPRTELSVHFKNISSSLDEIKGRLP